MKIFMLVFHVVLFGCSSVPQTNPTTSEEKEKTPTVSVESVLDHVQQSYTLGCVEAMRSIGRLNVYPQCRDKGRSHSDAVRQVLEGPPSILDE